MSVPFLLEIGTEEIPDWTIVPAINVLKCSNLFNLLDSRGAISVTERVAVIARVRKLAVGVAGLWVEQTLNAGPAVAA